MATIKMLTSVAAHEEMSKAGRCILIDVRDPTEFSFVGHPVGAVNIPWKFAPDMRDNPGFLAEAQQHIPNPETPVYLICRSGQRSLAAAKALEAVGYLSLINIEDGFEGPIDDHKHRGTLGGWRFNGLPWVQS